MRSQNTIQNSPDAIYTCDANGFIKTYNKAAVSLWGREPEVDKELWCGSWRMFNSDGQQLSMDRHPMAIALKEGRLVHGDELIVQRPDGSLKRISPYSSPLVNEQGQLTGVVSMLMEISERKDREKRSEEKYKIFIEQAADGIFLIDHNGNFISANISGCNMLGYNRQALLKLNVKDIVPKQYSGKMLANPDILKTGKPILVERQFLRKDGAIVYGELRIQLDYEGKIQAIVRDITERKNAEEAFKAMKGELMNQKIQEQKKITRAILNAQENERRHMGEELHDNINQMLAGTKLYLSVAGNNKAELKEALQYPIELIDETMNEIRLLTRRSTTPKQNINLKELVHCLLETLQKNTPIKIEFAYNVATDFNDDDLKLNIYRIIQEQTNNIMKHAEAAHVCITIETSNNIIEIKVTDDGRGFNVNKRREGIGLSNIINRAETFNGKVEIKSEPGCGTSLELKIPY